MNVDVKEKKITFSNGKILECIYNIKNHIIFNELLIILLDVPLNISDNRNVFGYDFKGNNLWQIQNLFPNDDSCPYNMIKIDENNLLHLYNWCGFIVKANPITGEVIEKLFTK